MKNTKNIDWVRVECIDVKKEIVIGKYSKEYNAVTFKDLGGYIYIWLTTAMPKFSKGKKYNITFDNLWNLMKKQNTVMWIKNVKKIKVSWLA